MILLVFRVIKIFIIQKEKNRKYEENKSKYFEVQLVLE